MSQNFKYWLYDKSKVTPWYFWKPKISSTDEKLSELWILEKESATELDFASSIKKELEPGILEKWFDPIKTAITEWLPQAGADIFEWVKRVWSDINKIASWTIAEEVRTWEEQPWIEKWILWRVVQKWFEREKEFSERKAKQWDIGQSEIEKKLDIVWQGLWFVWDVFWEWFISALNTLSTDQQKIVAKKAIKDVIESDLWKKGAEAAKQWWEVFKEFEAENPRVASQIRNLTNLWLTTLDVAWAWAWGKLWKETIESTGKQIDNLAENVVEIVNNAKLPEISTENIKESIWKGLEWIKQVPSKFTWDKPSKIAENIAGIDETTKIVLWRTNTEDFDKYLQIAKDAVDPKNPTPLEVAWDKTSDVLEEIKRSKSNIWSEKSKILNSVADIEIDTQPVLDDFREFLNERFNLQLDNNLNITEIPWKKTSVADASISDLQWLSDELLDLFTTDKINLANLDATVDRIQDSINFNKLNRAWGNATKSEKQISSFLEWKINQRLKNAAWQDFIDANNDFRRLLDIQIRLEKLLWPDKNRGGSLMKAVFSPTDRWTKKLFREIEEEFGIDLNTEAWLAKFAMQAAWDPRQASLLEALDLWEWFTKKLSEKFQNIPIIWTIAEFWEVGAKKLFPTEKVARELTK